MKIIATWTCTSAAALSLLFSGCDDDERPRQPTGGGPGAYNLVAASGDGFCNPVGGAASLGQASFQASSTAKVDLDGWSGGQGVDVSWNPETAGHVNGQAVDANRYHYVVMSPSQMQSSGVHLGDWAQVSNASTGQTTWARVEDVGPEGGQGEVSIAAAHAVGIGTTTIQTDRGTETVTTGNDRVTVTAYAGTSGIDGDCANSSST
jgi:hypothetical protein